MEVVSTYLAKYKSMLKEGEVGKHHLAYCGYVWKDKRNPILFRPHMRAKELKLSFDEKVEVIRTIALENFMNVYGEYKIASHYANDKIFVVCDEKDDSLCIRRAYAEMLRTIDKNIKVKEVEDLVELMGERATLRVVDSDVVVVKSVIGSLEILRNKRFLFIYHYADDRLIYQKEGFDLRDFIFEVMASI